MPTSHHGEREGDDTSFDGLAEAYWAAEAQALPGELREASQALRQGLERYEATLDQAAESLDRGQRLQVLLSGTAELRELPLSPSLDQNVQGLEALFRHAADWVLRPFRLAGGRRAVVAYLDGMVDVAVIDDHLVKPLMYDAFPLRAGPVTATVQEVLKAHAIAASQVREGATLGEVVNGILDGDALLLVDGEGVGLIVSQRGWQKRALSEPPSESTIRGPREGFTETLRTNTALLRRRLRTPSLKFEAMTVGTLSRTDVVIAYLDRIAADALVEEVRSRLERLIIDSPQDVQSLDELIRDAPTSLFPTIRVTERPDAVAGELLEGRVAILAANTPFVLVVPATFWGHFQSPEDYYHSFYVASALRLLRIVFAFLALTLPATYVAITTFHADMVPTSLLITIAAAREGVPFPALLEALMMEVMFEVLREAGLRLPRQVGQAVSIVGALVIGEAAVTAGIVSAPMVILVAMTGIASFTIPSYEMALAVRLLRFPVLLAAGFLGLFGVGAAIMFILVHLADLRSFSVPYLAPVAPLRLGRVASVFVRPPFWAQIFRPSLTAQFNRQRAVGGLKPQPPQTPAPSAGSPDGTGPEGEDGP